MEINQLLATCKLIFCATGYHSLNFDELFWATIQDTVYIASCTSPDSEFGKEAIKNFEPMQMGDVPATYADVTDLTRDTGFTPSTPIAEGIKQFVSWYKDYYKVST